jgi:hypothetical protein
MVPTSLLNSRGLTAELAWRIRGFGGTSTTAEPSGVRIAGKCGCFGLYNSTSIETVYSLHEQVHLSGPGK